MMEKQEIIGAIEHYDDEIEVIFYNSETGYNMELDSIEKPINGEVIYLNLYKAEDEE